MQRYGQKTSNMPQKWGFYPICDPQEFFFKNQALSLLYPYGTLTSSKKLEKNNEWSLRYLKTDHGRTNGPRTNGQGRLLRTPSGKPGVQNIFAKNDCPCSFENRPAYFKAYNKTLIKYAVFLYLIFLEQNVHFC